MRDEVPGSPTIPVDGDGGRMAHENGGNLSNADDFFCPWSYPITHNAQEGEELQYWREV